MKLDAGLGGSRSLKSMERSACATAAINAQRIHPCIPQSYGQWRRESTLPKKLIHGSVELLLAIALLAGGHDVAFAARAPSRERDYVIHSEFGRFELTLA